MRVNPLFAQLAFGCCVLCSAPARADSVALPQVDSAQPSATALQDAQSAERDDASLRQWLTNNGFVHQVTTSASDLVVNAMSFLGVKYRYGGDSARSGFDCSGFVRYVYQETLGTVLPHNAAQQAREGERISENQLKPGDLVFFNTLRRAFSHVGIYIGNGQFIHAPRTGQTIRVENLDAPYWSKRFDGARRILSGMHNEVGQNDPQSTSADPAGQ